MATIAIGDIHGHLAALEDLLAKIRPEIGDGDSVVFLGDYIDRGPDSRGCVEAVLEFEREVKAEVVCLAKAVRSCDLRIHELGAQLSWRICVSTLARPAHNPRTMTVLVAALLMGIVAGMRAMTAPAAVSWGAALEWLALGASPLRFLAHWITPWVFTLFALGEFVTDQLPTTPSRTVPVQFGTRLLTGGLSGAALGVSGGGLVEGIIAGVLGAVVGTLGGRRLRGRLATAFGSDRPAAFLEDAMAVALAALVVVGLT